MSEPAEPAPPPPEEPQMEFHKPKPIHNWRELLTEIGVVVIGVCIALGAEQTVEYFHWRTQVTDAREVIATEMASNLVVAVSRIRTVACTDRRLDQLAQIVDAAAKTGSLPPLGRVGMPPRGRWPSGAWDSVVASQTATHFPRQQLADISDAYKTAQRLEDLSSLEIETWNELYSMSGPGRRLDAASESELRKALSNARTFNGIYFSLSVQLAERVKALHLPFSQGDLESIAAAEHPPASVSPSFICQAIGPAPSFYGQGNQYTVTLSNGQSVTQDDARVALPDFSESAK